MGFGDWARKAGEGAARTAWAGFPGAQAGANLARSGLGAGLGAVGRGIGNAFRGDGEQASSQATQLPGYFSGGPRSGLPIQQSDYYNVASGMASAYFGEDSKRINAEMGRLRNRMAGADPRLGLLDSQSSQLRDNAGFDRRSLGLKEQGMGFDRAELGRLDPLLEAREQLAAQFRAMLDPERIDRDAQIKRDYERDRTRMASDATGRGATMSRGYERERGWLDEDKDTSMRESGRRYERDVLGADQDMKEAHEARQKNRDRKNRLELEAAQLGIDRERLESELKYGLGRIGLSKQMTVQDLTDLLMSKSAEEAALGRAIQDRIMQTLPILQSMPTLPPSMVKYAVR